LIEQTREWGGFSDRVRMPHDVETGDPFHVAWTTLRCHGDGLGFMSTGILRPIPCSRAASSSPKQAPLSRPALIAPFAAASQLEPTFSFGGPPAGADTTCDPRGVTASTIVAKAEAVGFT
jgi:hypothetical protein